MYYCHSCKEAFETPAIEQTRHEELDGCPVEEHSVCPYCGSGDCGEAVECESCGKYFELEEDGYFTDALGRIFCSEYCAIDYHEIRRVSNV